MIVDLSVIFDKVTRGESATAEIVPFFLGIKKAQKIQAYFNIYSILDKDSRYDVCKSWLSCIALDTSIKRILLLLS